MQARPEKDIRILAVDDDPFLTSSLQRTLRDYCTEVANTAAEGMEKLNEFSPDLLLLDVEMPTMSGHEMCRLIRADKRHQFLKVIFISGRNDIDDRLNGYQSGADDYISKPFNSKELQAKIRVLSRLKAVEEIDSLKNNFLHLICHETRTPITGIRGFCELIQDNADLSREELINFINIIDHSAHRIHDFCERAILICRLHGEKDIAKSTVSTNELINTVAELTAQAANLKSVQTEVDVQEASLYGDQSLLTKALCAIVDNGIKFSSKGQTIRIEGSSGQTAYQFRVIDHGAGVPSDMINNIFDLFSITDIRHHHSGTGLSLALTKKIVEHHSGQIDVTSAAGQGSTFTITLPFR